MKSVIQSVMQRPVQGHHRPSFLQNRHVAWILRWALRLTLAGIFLYAGVQKIGAPQAFSDSIATFAILPESLINLLALALPPFEILAALAVVTGVQRRAALLGLGGLTAVFMAALGSAIVRGIPVDCGCFGSETPSTAAAWHALLRDIPLFALALGLYLWEGLGSGARRGEDQGGGFGKQAAPAAAEPSRTEMPV